MPPKGRDASLETYIRKTWTDVELQLNNLQATRYKYKNILPSKERIALRSLQQWNDIIIKPANKGSAMVVFSKIDYINEADRQLNDHSYYQKLTVDPTSQYTSKMKDFVDSMFNRGLTDKKTR